MIFTLDKALLVMHNQAMNAMKLQRLSQVIPRSDPAEAPAAPSQATRSLHLVDVENLVGGTNFTEADVAIVSAAYRSLADFQDGDLIVVGSSHHTAQAAWFGWGTARRVVRSGPDGADLALINVLETENVAMRFERIVIGSGDKIFASPAAMLQSAGVALTVVSRPESLSNQLRLASRDVRYLELLPALHPVASQRVAA